MKIWPGSVAVCCGSLLLAGCYDNDKIMMLAEAQDNLRNENVALHKQIKALGKAILILNQDIVDIKHALRAEECAVAEKKAATTNELAAASEAKSATEAELTAKALRAPVNYTRLEFMNKVIGMSPEQIAQFIGEPDNKTERDAVIYWGYNELACKKDGGDGGGGVEIGAAQIIFENDRVCRVNFVEDVQYGGLPALLQE